MSVATLSAALGCQRPHPPTTQPAGPRGLVLIFPGVVNVRSQMANLAEMVNARHPGLLARVQPWGPPLRWIRNLTDVEANRRCASELAGEIAAYRRSEPEAIIDLVGYSGGGGFAALVVEALPDDVQIDRLVLVAAALSRSYPFEAAILPHVREFVVCYSSPLDVQVGIGTRVLGNVDGARSPSIGAVGPAKRHPRVIHVRWEAHMCRQLHFGNHLSYLSTAWQRKYLAPALDPSLDADELRVRLGAR